MKTRRNPYSTNLAMLRDYLNSGVDVYSYSHMLERFYDDEMGGEYPDEFDLSSFEDNVDRMSKSDIKKFREWLCDQDLHVDSPVQCTLSDATLVPRETWLVHFTNNADDIIQEGFVCGHEDMYYGLHLTTWFNKKIKCRPGWNFAFEAGSRYARSAAREQKYGREAVMFQSAGVKAYHHGDSEEQVIFWGLDVKSIIPLWLSRDDGEFRIEDREDGRIIYKSDFDKVSDWVKRNARQYGDRIAYFKE